MDELINDFLVETNEGLGTLDTEIVKLEQNPEDNELLSSIFRIMHTIKGTCGFLNLPRLEAIAHVGENVLGKIRDGQLTATPNIVSIILEVIDVIKLIVAHIEATSKEPEGDDSELIERINNVVDTISAAEDLSFAAQSIQEQEPLDKPEVGKTEEIKQLQEESSENTQSVTDVKLEEVSQSSTNIVSLEPVLTEDQKKEAIEQGLKTDLKKGGSTQSIRVNLDVIENLMQTVSELVLTRNQMLQLARIHKDSEFAPPIQRLSHITTELQERIMKTRMQPIGNAWAQFPRLVRDLAHELGKKIELRMYGQETELDRQLIESIKDPLTHMIRNSADHGLETPDKRRATSKNETGIITLKAHHQGGHIIIEVSDDGRGLNTERIKSKVIANGLASESDLVAMSDQQIYQYIFKAGFSTAEKVTSISGRGVGMDVVKTNIEKISGTIELKSIEGKGSTFTIKIPLTLAIMPVLIIESGGEKFAIPQINILELVKTGGSSEYDIEKINSRPVLRLRQSLLTLAYLSDILRIDSKTKENENHFIVVCENGGYNFGIVVDRVFDTEEIVVKPVTPVLRNIDVYSGSTVLGDGSVVMILDPNGLARSAGEPILGKDPSKSVDQHDNASYEKQVSSFLILRVGNTTPKAVPLEVVSRLEEIDVSKIEYSRDKTLVQYRDQLMYLHKLDPNFKIPSEGTIQVIVFIDKGRIMGLVVEEILDIVEHTVNFHPSSVGNGYLGAMVINDKTTDLIDVSYFFTLLFGKDKEKEAEEDNNNLDNKPSILLIDDSPFFRKFIPPTLIAGGYRVVAVESGQAAIEILERGQKFSVIITDVNMPGISGAEFSKFCMNDERFNKIPIVALSSNVTDSLVKNFKNSGIKAHVSKTNHGELLATIAKVLQYEGA